MDLIIPSSGRGFARYAAESEAPHLRRGLVGAWLPFLGATGATLHGWAGRGNNGVLEASPPWVDTPYGAAIDFNGSSHRVGLDAIPVTYPTTFLAWIYPHTLAGGDRRLVTSDVTVTDHDFWQLAYINGATQWQLWDGDAQRSLFGVGAVATNQWQLVGFTVDQARLATGYVDGKGLLTATTGTNGTWNISSLALASEYVGAGWYDGLIASALIYDRALDANEIEEIYERPYAMWRWRSPVFGFVSVVANDLLLLQNTNLRGNLQDLRGGLR